MNINPNNQDELSAFKALHEFEKNHNVHKWNQTRIIKTGSNSFVMKVPSLWQKIQAYIFGRGPASNRFSENVAGGYGQYTQQERSIQQLLSEAPDSHSRDTFLLKCMAELGGNKKTQALVDKENQDSLSYSIAGLKVLLKRTDLHEFQKKVAPLEISQDDYCLLLTLALADPEITDEKVNGVLEKIDSVSANLQAVAKAAAQHNRVDILGTLLQKGITVDDDLFSAAKKDPLMVTLLLEHDHFEVTPEVLLSATPYLQSSFALEAANKKAVFLKIYCKIEDPIKHLESITQSALRLDCEEVISDLIERKLIMENESLYTTTAFVRQALENGAEESFKKILPKAQEVLKDNGLLEACLSVRPSERGERMIAAVIESVARENITQDMEQQILNSNSETIITAWVKKISQGDDAAEAKKKLINMVKDEPERSNTTLLTVLIKRGILDSAAAKELLKKCLANSNYNSPIEAVRVILENARGIDYQETSEGNVPLFHRILLYLDNRSANQDTIKKCKDAMIRAGMTEEEMREVMKKNKNQFTSAFFQQQ